MGFYARVVGVRDWNEVFPQCCRVVCEDLCADLRVPHGSLRAAHYLVEQDNAVPCPVVALVNEDRSNGEKRGFF